MGACGSADQNRRKENQAPSGEAADKKSLGKAWTNEEQGSKKEKNKKVNKADVVSAFESPKSNNGEKKMTVKPLKEAEENAVQSIAPQQEVAEKPRTLDDVRPKAPIFSTGKPSAAAENSPGRAAPGFLPTPTRSGNQVVQVDVKEQRAKHTEDNAEDGQNSATAGKTETHDDDTKRENEAGRTQVKGKTAEPQKVFFQKPVEDHYMDEVDDLPCEVIPTGIKTSTRGDNDENVPSKNNGTNDSKTEKKDDSTKVTPKRDFLKKKSKMGTLPALAGNKKKGLVPLTFDKKKHQQFRKSLKGMKKSGNRMKKMEKYIVKRIGLPTKAADLIMVYAAMKTSTLDKFSVADVQAKAPLTDRNEEQANRKSLISQSPDASTIASPAKGLMTALG